ncbi:hypothetical protein [Shinella zoogloeoides]|uniref:hypothetical protein n=1 Tax=Shinella zoogloeoides TaxID=352475 RepID=UPI001F5A7634|nr:hypothetical protein [Shinella zoogloeoides]
MRLLGGALLALVVFASPAAAGFNSWTSESTPDPFTGGVKVEVNYSSSLRSGIFILCDSADHGLEVRAIAGWDYVADLDKLDAEGKIAVDGKVILDVKGKPGAYGNNVAGVSFVLKLDEARTLVDALAGAQSQVAIKDGISAEPHLMGARGSTKSASSLQKCLSAQLQRGGTDSAKEGGSDSGESPGAGEGRRMAMFVLSAFATEQRCKNYKLRSENLPKDEPSAEVKAEFQRILKAEKEQVANSLAKFSCHASAAEVMKYTDLSYDDVWSVQ